MEIMLNVSYQWVNGNCLEQRKLGKYVMFGAINEDLSGILEITQSKYVIIFSSQTSEPYVSKIKKRDCAVLLCQFWHSNPNKRKTA